MRFVFAVIAAALVAVVVGIPNWFGAKAVTS